MSFATALAISETVRAFVPPETEVQLKWPNDVLVNGKKISGILLEASPVEAGQLDWLVVGLGINVEHHPEGGLYPTTSLRAEGAKATVAEVRDAFLRHFNPWRLALQHDGFEPIRKAWLSHTKTGPMTVRLPDQTVLEGTFGGLDSRGGLILRLADGAEQVIDAGDVFFPQGV